MHAGERENCIERRSAAKGGPQEQGLPGRRTPEAGGRRCRPPWGGGRFHPEWKRLLAACCALVIALAQWILLWPAFAEDARAETAGESFSVRVQYFGERGDMIREKARFTRSDLAAMGAQQYFYSNVTRVGTVMSMAAYGPQVLTIIEAAGIDPGSVKNITFRTTDGYTRNFNVEEHLSGGRFYYPYLSSGYETGDDGKTLIPLEGSLEDAAEVPAILALEFGATKAPDVDAQSLSMGTRQTYRFCMGQTPLAEGVQTRPGEDGGDVSSMDSVHSIYGMDVTLAGSPVEGIGIDPLASGAKVGSVVKLTIHVDGDALFAEDFGKALGKLTWSSSNPSIAKVDQEGNVTILKEGSVTITVKTASGLSASIPIHATKDGKADATRQKATQKTTDPAAGEARPPAAASRMTTGQMPQVHKVQLRELSLGARVEETRPAEETDHKALEEDTAALEKQRDYGPGTAAGASAAAIAACSAGGILRFRRYRSILKGWKH